MSALSMEGMMETMDEKAVTNVEFYEDDGR